MQNNNRTFFIQEHRQIQGLKLTIKQSFFSKRVDHLKCKVVLKKGMPFSSGATICKFSDDIKSQIYKCKHQPLSDIVLKRQLNLNDHPFY